MRSTYLTPDSTLPFVWARYDWHSRGVKPQCAAKAANVGFSLGSPSRMPSTAVRMQCTQQKLAAAVEVGEGGFVRGQQAAHALAREALRKAAPAVAQGHHEDVNLGAHAAQ